MTTASSKKDHNCPLSTCYQGGVCRPNWSFSFKHGTSKRSILSNAKDGSWLATAPRICQLQEQDSHGNSSQSLPYNTTLSNMVFIKAKRFRISTPTPTSLLNHTLNYNELCHTLKYNAEFTPDS